MAQLVEHRVVTWEVVSSTLAGPTLRVLKYLRNKRYLCNYISKWLDFKSSQIRTINCRPRLTVPSMFKMSTWDLKKSPHHLKRVQREVPGVVAVLLSSKCGWLDGDVLKRLAMYEATYAKTATSQKETLPSARSCKITNSQLYIY